jgi:hypothetical protein
MTSSMVNDLSAMAKTQVVRSGGSVMGKEYENYFAMEHYKSDKNDMENILVA